MKKLNLLSVLIFLISAALFAYAAIVINAEIDKNGPKITVPASRVEMSIHDDESKILEGVTALDSKDGDATATLVVENVSNMMEDGIRTANIVAFDSDNNITRETRDLVYTDYTAPRFSLDAPLRFSDVYSNITKDLHAEACLDGDISNRIRVSFDNTIDYDSYGEITVNFTVANSIGDTTKLPATVEFYDPNGEQNRPRITLSDYLVYTGIGDSFDPLDYVESINCNGRNISKDRHGKFNWDEIPEEKYDDEGNLLNEDAFKDLDELVTSDKLMIDNPVDFSTSGTYEIVYSIENYDNIVGKTRLIVVVTNE